jgi:ketosteroid isomerase-like protein
MKLKHLFSAALCLTLSSLSWSQTLQNEIEARYRGFNHALQHRDAKFLNGYLSPDFTVELPMGKSADREGSIKGFTDLMNQAKTIDWTFKLSQMAVVSRGVSVMADGHMSATAIGPDKKKHRLDLHGLTEDTWILQGDTWLLDHVKFLKLDGLIDGKPAPIPGVSG